MEWIVVVGVAILSLVVVWILVFQKDSNRRKPSESTRNVQKARLAFYSSRAGLGGRVMIDFLEYMKVFFIA